MSYIGRGLQSGAFRQLDDISSGFDGSDTTHTMQVNSTNVTVGDVNQILLSLGGVIQKPGTDFTVSSSTLTFTTAPAANTSFFAILLGSDNGGTVTPTDASVTNDKISSALTTIAGLTSAGAAGTVTSIAGANILVEANSLFIGDDVSGTTDTAANSVAVGIDALDAVTTGDANVAIGKSALSGNTTGGNNIAIGNQALNAPDTESSNIAIGSNALNGSVAGGEYNVAIGVTAGNALTSADYVVAIGNAAGSAITTGGKHILIGHNAGSGLTTSAGSCVYIGTGAGSGSNNDAETNNIGIGEDTMGAAGNTINGAEYNIAIGNLALDALTTGDYNLAVGYQAGSALTTGSYNHLFGREAGKSITTANHNTLLGSAAGTAITTGGGNVIIGEAGFAFDTETNNMAIGHAAFGGSSIAGAEYNLFIGNYSGDAVTSGDTNTAVGYSAGTAITTGASNVCLGKDAGDTITTGDKNIVIGQNAAVYANDSDNGIIIGHDLAAYATNTHITMGTGSGTDRIYVAYHSNATWARVSDERYKENIKPNTDCGLDFINDLNPVTFTWKAKADIDPSLPDYDETKLEPTYDKKMYGMIAQEVKSAMDKHGIEDFGGWGIEEKHGIQSVAQSMFVYPLIKAVQELSIEVEQLKEKIKEA